MCTLPYNHLSNYIIFPHQLLNIANNYTIRKKFNINIQREFRSMRNAFYLTLQCLQDVYVSLTSLTKKKFFDISLTSNGIEIIFFRKSQTIRKKIQKLH